MITRPDTLAGRLHDSMPGPFTAQVIEVVDGDTLEVRVQIWLGQEVITRVRMTGIDTPELRGQCDAEKARAREAKALLARLVAPGTVILRDVTYDKYGGRVLAAVSGADGRGLADQMIGAGLARPYQGGGRAGWC
ncbi:nuclease [Zavarzinia compransoris]|uniref:Nuclease n=2 Tax=Zavarzinia compransoris TaxID=1264899 RepID=A0A317EBI3_9PROT|nr:nuclease [Zavarzinia compransoris]